MAYSLGWWATDRSKFSQSGVLQPVCSSTVQSPSWSIRPADLLDDTLVGLDRRVLVARLAKQRRHKSSIRAVQSVVGVPTLTGPGFPRHSSGEGSVILAARVAAVIDLNGLCLVDEVGYAVAGDTRPIRVRKLGHKGGSNEGKKGEIRGPQYNYFCEKIKSHPFENGGFRGNYNKKRNGSAPTKAVPLFDVI